MTCCRHRGPHRVPLCRSSRAQEAVAYVPTRAFISPSAAHVLPALYASLVAHANALKSLQREHKKHLEREKSLGDILNSLRSGYNPNYQDMAVLEAVRGWEYHAGLPHIGVEEDAENKDEEGSDDVEEAPEAVEEELEEGMWTAERLEKDLDGLLKADYVSLLMEHDTHIGASSTESICGFLNRTCVPWHVVH